MKILMLIGSRNAEGQTACAANAMLEGAAGAGAEVEQVFMTTLKMERCSQCDDDGWGLCRKEGSCVIKDDFASMVEKVQKADAVVFATPVYYSELSESLRAFTDRLRRVSGAGARPDGIKGKPGVGLCVAGGGGGGAPACCVSLEFVLATCGFEVGDVIPVRRQNLEAKLPRLRLAGEWLATAAPTA